MRQANEGVRYGGMQALQPAAAACVRDQRTGGVRMAW
jgi:hypothetical protein